MTHQEMIDRAVAHLRGMSGKALAHDLGRLTGRRYTYKDGVYEEKPARPYIDLACPVCEADIDRDDIQVRPPTEDDHYTTGFYLSGCCSIDSLYWAETLEQAEDHLIRYVSSAVLVGIRKAYQMAERALDNEQRAIEGNRQATILFYGTPANVSGRIVHGHGGYDRQVYCRNHVPSYVGDDHSYFRGIDFCRHCRRVVGTYGDDSYSISGCPGDVAARDSF